MTAGKAARAEPTPSALPTATTVSCAPPLRKCADYPRRRISHGIKMHDGISQPIGIGAARAEPELKTTAELGQQFILTHRLLRAAFDGVAPDFDYVSVVQRDFDARRLDCGRLDRRIVHRAYFRCESNHCRVAYRGLLIAAKIDAAIGQRAREAVRSVELRVHNRVATEVVRLAHGEPVDVAHADLDCSDVARLHALLAQLDAKADSGVVAAAARIGLEAVFADAPVTAERVGQDFGFDFIALVKREQTRVAFERAARAGQSIGGKKRTQYRSARSKACTETFRQHTVAHALRRTAGLMECHAERIAKTFGVELEQMSRGETRCRRAKHHCRMPTLAKTVVACKPEPRVQLSADRMSEQKILAGNAADVFGCGTQRWQHDAVGMHARLGLACYN